MGTKNSEVISNYNPGNTLNKTFKSTAMTTTTTFRETVQRGVLSGAGILKK